MRTALLCTAALLSLAGCVNMSGLGGSSKYSCAAPEGVACDSMSGTYANAVHNNLPSQRSGDTRAPSGTSSPGSAADTPGGSRRPLSGALASVADGSSEGDSAMALRSQARVLRLWTKPWEDADGDLWDQGYVYVQVDAGRWQIDHVRQRIRDQFAPLRPPPAPSASSGNGATGPGTSTGEPDTASSSLSSVQRPSPFDTSFPSLARPPVDLGVPQQ